MYRSNLPFSFSVSSLLALLFAWSADLSAAPVELVEQAPVTISQPTPEVLLVDFGRVAFGNLKLTPPADATGNIAVRFGEQLVQGRIDRPSRRSPLRCRDG